VIEDRIRNVLEPVARLYRRDSSLRVPMLSGTIPGALFVLGLLLLALAQLLSGDPQEAWQLVIAAPVVFANWFIVGFVVAAVIQRLMGHRLR